MQIIEAKQWRGKSNMWDVIVVDIIPDAETGETTRDITTYPISGETKEDVINKWHDKYGDKQDAD